MGECDLYLHPRESSEFWWIVCGGRRRKLFICQQTYLQCMEFGMGDSAANKTKEEKEKGSNIILQMDANQLGSQFEKLTRNYTGSQNYLN